MMMMNGEGGRMNGERIAAMKAAAERNKALLEMRKEEKRTE